MALYAEAFDDALGQFGSVEQLRFPPDPASTQKLTTSVRWFLRGLLRPPPAALIHVEVSGRALAEFYFVVGLLLRGHRPWVAMTCHDAPSIVGSPAMFSILDRPGLRRLGDLLSTTLASSAERWVMSRCDSVFALSSAGSAHLTQTYGRPVHELGLIIPTRARNHDKQPIIFIAGYVSPTCPVKRIVAAALAAPPSSRGPWRVVVGAAQASFIDSLRESLSEEELSATTFLQNASEADLLNAFASAAVVLRAGCEAGAANRLAASGPIAWAMSFDCLTIVDDPRPYTLGMAEQGLLTYAPDVIPPLVAAMADADGTLTHATHPRAEALYGTSAIAARLSLAVMSDAGR